MKALQTAWLVMVSTVAVRGDFATSPNLARSGNSDGHAPFLLTQQQVSSLRYQAVFGASDFTVTGVPALLITEISFAADPLSLPIDVSLPNIQINISTTIRNPDRLSNIFAENVGLDDTVVFSGPLHFFDSGVERFGIHIALQTPFSYDPGLGNLLVDIRNFQTTGQSTFGMALDYENTMGDTASQINGLVNSPSGSAVSAVMVTRFTFTPIPEPSTLGLLFLGTLLGGCFGWNRLRRARSIPSRTPRLD